MSFYKNGFSEITQKPLNLVRLRSEILILDLQRPCLYRATNGCLCQFVLFVSTLVLFQRLLILEVGDLHQTYCGLLF